jgi:uncharacterized protein (DUF1501 family)
MLSRRDFLHNARLLALAPTVPAFLASAARSATVERDGRVLVVLELDGGNDGINTVVPYRDEGYALQRRRLRLPREQLVGVSGDVGLHPSLTAFAKLLESGRLAIVQGVGYPRPSRSHFRSMAVWQSARLDPEEHGGSGWLGRALDAGGASRTVSAQLIGTGPPPVALRGRRAVAASLQRREDFRLPAGAEQLGRTLSAAEPGDDLAAFVHRSLLDTCVTAGKLAEAGSGDANVRYPGSDLAGRLRLIARLLEAGLGTRIFYTRLGGFDTHSAQLFRHANLLATLGGAVAAFLADLKAAKLDERVVVLVFSEFGRTVKENASAGTDHGTAGPVFLAGAGVKGGVVGATPSLTELDPVHGDLKLGVDFRRVYASVLERWLGLPAKEALGGSFEPLTLFRG